MTMVALLVAAISTVGICVREISSGSRQKNALRSLERLAEHHPDSARLVAEVVTAANPEREPPGRKLRRRP